MHPDHLHHLLRPLSARDGLWARGTRGRHSRRLAGNRLQGARPRLAEGDLIADRRQIVFIGELLYVLTTTVTKMAIAAYFLRLSSRVYQRRTVYLTLAVVLSFSTAYFFFLIFQCGPISYLWEQYHASPELDGHCVSSTAFAAITYAHCAMSAVTDWVFGILPIFFVWKMQMDPRTKFSIILILSLGFL